jgi:hypothetical protein
MTIAKKLIAATIVTASLFLGPPRAEAAPPFVERRLTLPTHDWAFDLGLGIGHYDFGDNFTGTGAGLNFEGAVSVVHHLELGFRDGLRFGNGGVLRNDGALGRGDQYGRLFDRETFGTGNDTVSNPELRIRGELVDSSVIELALEGRAYLPIEQFTRFGVLFGVPLAFHLGSIVKLETGAYIPVVFQNPTDSAVSLPFNAWFQVSSKVWLGPMTGFRIDNPGARRSRGDFSAGFGLGYQITRYLDFKTQFLVPAVGNANNFGFGAGIQIRIE